MKTFKKTLKILLSDNRQPLLTSYFDIADNDLRFLAAKKLIEVKPYYDGDLQIILTDQAITYFYDKAQHRKGIIINWSFNTAMAILSAVCGSAITLLIQHALMI